MLVSTVFVIPTLNIYGYEDWVTFSDRDDWSYKIYSSEDEITLQNLIIKFKKGGYYKIHVEDMDWNESHIQINVDWDWHWSATDNSNWSSNSNKNLDIALSPINSNTDEWVSLIIKTDSNYVGKVDFSKLEYRSSSSASRSLISGDYSTYVSDDSFIWEFWYYKLSSSDKGEVILDHFAKFKKGGYYRLYVEDNSWNKRYQQIVVNWTNDEDEEIEKIINDLLQDSSTDENYEIYESRSCEKYRIEFNDILSAYTSPDLKTTEYFINLEYFKRYIDSKNTQNVACNNKSWISYPYVDTYTWTNYIVAPNGKIYFTEEINWLYTSNQLKSWVTFPSFNELRLYINASNPLTEMN